MGQVRQCFSVCLLLLSGCLHTSQVTWDIKNRDDMKEVIVQNVPVGSSIQEATKFMEHEGFACTVKSNENFKPIHIGLDPGLDRNGIDFLECKRSQLDGSLFFDREWDIALVLDHEKVAEVLVGCCVEGI